MTRYRVAVVHGKEYPFQIEMTREVIRKVLTGMLGVSEKEIEFKPGTYIFAIKKG